MSPNVSVIMSVYNGEKYLREAIDSILNQTFTDFEFIIINDGSTDGTREILESYSDSRIRLIHQENIGLTKSLNRGLKLARGEYIARQDADDVSYPERLSYQVVFIEKRPDVVLVGTHASFIDQRGTEFSVWRPPATHDAIRKQMLKGNSFCHGSVIFRKECLNTVGSYREQFRYTQDYDLWFRISDQYEVANIERILYKFRRNSHTISRKKLSQQLDYHLLTIELAKERRRRGKDSLSNIETSNIESALTGLYKLTRSEINHFKSSYFMMYCTESLRSRNYLDALTLWLKGFHLEPQKSKIKFIIQQFIKTL